MFKGTEPTKYIQLAYMTGILPIKKQKTQSALNNFKDYSMLYAGPLASYVGFTEDEVITYLIHLGYLAYDQGFKTAVIPNEEIRQELVKATRRKKWNKSADTALQQIEERRYPDSVRSYTGSILLVGINYDTHTKEHTCLIKKYIKES